MTEQMGKLWAEVSVRTLGVVVFKVPIMALVKVNHDGHDLASR